MIDFPDADDLYDELCQLVELGPRFHGTTGEEAAADFISKRLSMVGGSVSAHQVTTSSWRPSGESLLEVTSPQQLDIDSWPLLWSSGTDRYLAGSLQPEGTEGLWDNSFVWTKFKVVDGDQVVAYALARDEGPAAPQPLPAGSSPLVPHLAIGSHDGRRLREMIADCADVQVRMLVPVETGRQATGHNLELFIPGASADSGEMVVCGHYDTFWNTVGAYDNGSGTIALLELARRWTSRPPRRSVRLVFFAAEEWHLAGSRALVRSLGEAERSHIDFVLNIDGLGRGDFLECSVGPETFEHDLTSQIRRFHSGRTSLEVSSRFPPLMGTDHAAFYAAGIPSAHITFNDWRILHRPEDIPNRESARNIAWTIALVEHLEEVLDRPERAPYHDIL